MKWEEKIRLGDIFHNDDLSFVERRDLIVRRVKRSKWYKRSEDADTPLWQVVEALGDAEDADEFDEIWDAVYDEADIDRVWIETTRAIK